MLYYIPVYIMLTANLWYGVTVHYAALETALYILSMFCVGFLEEVIFRGLLFEAMREESERAATIVSAVTFGIGHIINLFNGSGTELLPNLLQVVYATAAGFMFEPGNFINNLQYMGSGMLGIFVVIGIIIGATALLNFIFRPRKK